MYFSNNNSEYKIKNSLNTSNKKIDKRTISIIKKNKIKNLLF